MPTATYLNKDQNWIQGTTTYWFAVAPDWGNAGVFGIVEGGLAPDAVVDFEGCDVPDTELRGMVKAACVVTDEMRNA